MKVGDRVRIVDHAFAGLVGTLAAFGRSRDFVYVYHPALLRIGNGEGLYPARCVVLESAVDLLAELVS